MTPSAFGTAMINAIQQGFVNELAAGHVFNAWHTGIEIPPEVLVSLAGNVDWAVVIEKMKGRAEESIAMVLFQQVQQTLFPQIDEMIAANPQFIDEITNVIKAHLQASIT
jgi:hypothetical protein